MNEIVLQERLLYFFMILFGLGNCFFGYRIFRVLIGIWGFIVGFSIGLRLALYLQIFGIGRLLIAFIIGGFCILLVSFLYYAGVFIFGAAIGFFLTDYFTMQFAATPHLVWIIAGSLLGGILTLVMQKSLIIILTAFSGAVMTIAAIFSLLTGTAFQFRPGDVHSSLAFLAALTGCAVLLVLGMISQFAMRKKTVKG